MNFRQFPLVLIVIAMLGGCQPSSPPRDALKTQHEALEKAKGVEAQLQQGEQNRLKAAEDASK